MGTGFFVLPGVVLTCEHVCPAAETDTIQIEWQGRDLTVTGVIRPPLTETPDLLLIVVKENDHPLLPLGPAEDLLARFYAFGYQFADRYYKGYSTSGELSGPAWDHKLAVPRRLLVLRGASVADGLSGGPAYSMVDRCVVGVIVRHNPDGGGYAVPIEEVNQLRDGLLAENGRLTGGIALGPYIEQLQREHSYVTLADLDRDVRLDEIYVTLTLASLAVSGARQGLDSTGRPTDSGRSAKIDFRRDQGTPQRQHRQPEVPLSELIAQPAAIVLGEPGAGKTTLIRHLVVRTCRGQLFAGRTPVFIKLAALRREAGAVRTYLRDVFPQFAKAIERESDQGRAVYFLDGLDEISRTDQQVLAAEIVRLAAQRNHVYVTCRTAAFPSGMLPSVFRVFECVGFNSSQRRRFLKQWFESRPAQGRDLAHRIDVQPALTGFGRSPLLLSLLAMLFERRGGDNLPVYRADLYGRLIDEMLQRRDGDEHGIVLQQRAKQRLLQHLALAFMRRRREALSDDDVLALIGDFQIGGEGYQLRTEDPEAVLAIIVKRDGMLTYDDRGGIRFIHRTFQEFLAASALLRLGAVGQAEIATHAGDPLWEEATLLFASQLLTADADRFLTDLRSSTGSELLESHDRLLLAARCAAESAVSATILDGLLQELVAVVFGSDLFSLSAEASFALGAICTTRPGLIGQIQELVNSGGFGGSLRASYRLISLLGIVSTDESLEGLMLLLNTLIAEPSKPTADEEIWVQMVVRVLEAVGQNGGASGEQVLRLLGSPYSSIAAAAAAALEQLRPFASAEVIERYWEAPQGVRLLALPALLRTASPEQIRSALRRVYVEQPEPDLQIALRPITEPEHVEGDDTFASGLIADCSDPVSLANLLSVAPLMNYLSTSRPLMDHALDTSHPHRVRSAALQSLLARDGARAAEVFDQLLARSEYALATVAAGVLARTGNFADHRLLIERTRSRPRLIDMCVSLFTAVPSGSAVPWLRKLAAGTVIEPRRIRVILALAAACDVSSIPPLAEYLNAGNPAYRAAAYQALSALPSPEIPTMIVGTLCREDNVTVITQGIVALSSMTDTTSERLLIRCLEPVTWPALWPARSPQLRRGEQRPSDRRLVAALIGLAGRGVVDALPRMWKLVMDSKEPSEVRETAYSAVRTLSWLAVSKGSTS